MSIFSRKTESPSPEIMRVEKVLLVTSEREIAVIRVAFRCEVFDVQVRRWDFNGEIEWRKIEVPYLHLTFECGDKDLNKVIRDIGKFAEHHVLKEKLLYV